jgi:type III secretory pathway lipoprotein EscJ
MAQRPAIRWSLAMTAVGLAIGSTMLAFWALSSLSTVGARHLLAGRRLSSDDLIKVCQALDRHRVVYRVDDERRVQVSADQFNQAAELVAKLDLGQHSIDEIRDGQSSWQRLFEPPNERERKKNLAHEKILERLINQLDGVGWSLVSIDRPHSVGWTRSAATPSAFVYVETERNRRLPYQTIQAIPVLVSRYENGLTPASVTVMDTRGTTYFDAGNVTVGNNSRDRAREDELAAEIIEVLGWIKGVRVQVQVSTDRLAEPATVAASPSAELGTIQTHAVQTAGSYSDPKAIGSASVTEQPLIGVNRPLTLDPNPEIASQAKPSGGSGREIGVTAAWGTVTAVASAPGSMGRSEQLRELGRILIYVPRSFYQVTDARSADREPTRDELLGMRDRTERQIHTAIGHVIPDANSWKVDIDIIPDELSRSQLPVLRSAEDPRHQVLDWGIVGAVGAAVSILAAVGSWIHVARRPLRIPGPALESRRYQVNGASDRVPSERVRELIRRNPEAAASVLRRWVSEGGQAV